jgi:hypothetical protein
MKGRFSQTLLTVGIACLIVCHTPHAVAQNGKTLKKGEATKATDNGIGTLRLYDMKFKPKHDDVPARADHYLIVQLTSEQDNNGGTITGDAEGDLASSNITIKFLPSGRVIPSSVINNDLTADEVARTENKGNTTHFKTIQIGLKDVDESRPEPGDDQVELTFAVLHFKGLTKPGVTGAGPIFNATNIAKRIEADRQALSDAVAHAKTDDEKDAFIGLNVVVPSGAAASQGSGEINFNKDLYASTLGQAALFDHIKVGFHLNKASETTADPRHFDFGFTFRKTFLRADRAKLNIIRDAINGGNPNSPSATSPIVTLKEGGKETKEPAIEAINNLQKDFFRAFIIDNALRFEGDVSDRGISNVSNLLWDSQLQIATVSRAFAGQTGFWNFRFVPIGCEVGGNLTNNDDPTQAKRSLARVKSGGELNLIFKAASPNEPISRISLSAKALERYLFKDEATLDEMTKKVVMTDKGSKYWLQADLKVSTGIRVGVGRVGFKATFQRGFLPPVYNFVKTFKFGVIFETNDDDNSGNIKP